MNALATSAQVAVVGTGAMGAGIAQVALQAGHPVLLYDVGEGAAARGKGQILQRLSRLVEKGRLGAAAAEGMGAALQVVDSLDALADADLVIEAIVEKLDAKRELFQALEARVRRETLLATNTSSVSVTAIAAGLQYPERLAGLHFFNPAPLMALVEVVSGLATSQATRATLFATAQAWGKQPVHARSTPGFIVNRVARPFYAESLRLLEEGAADVPTLDALLRDAGGFPMGAFELMDLIGHDVNAAVTRSVFDAFAQDPRFKPSLLQQELVAAGRLGRKSGLGFYDYREGEAGCSASQCPASPAPMGIRVEGDLGPAAALLEGIRAAGIEVTTAPGEGLIRLAHCTLALTDGRTATTRSADEGFPDLVLFDLVLDWAQPARIALSVADQAPDTALAAAAGLLQRAGWVPTAIDDAPGLVVMRTLAMLANEAADAVLQAVASAQAIDLAMRLGTNYPRGPLAWAQAVGCQRIWQVLSHLQAHYGEDRYRPSAYLRRHALSGIDLLQPNPVR